MPRLNSIDVRDTNRIRCPSSCAVFVVPSCFFYLLQQPDIYWQYSRHVGNRSIRFVPHDLGCRAGKQQTKTRCKWKLIDIATLSSYLLGVVAGTTGEGSHEFVLSGDCVSFARWFLKKCPPQKGKEDQNPRPMYHTKWPEDSSATALKGSMTEVPFVQMMGPHTSLRIYFQIILLCNVD